MNNKITPTSLAAMLALRSGESQNDCESFLSEFFALIESGLAAGDNVKIKGFGTFKVIEVSRRRSVDVNTGEEIEIPDHKKIVFVPSKELAEEVNTPFEAFESVEINPEAEEELMADTIEEPGAEDFGRKDAGHDDETAAVYESEDETALEPLYSIPDEETDDTTIVTVSETVTIAAETPAADEPETTIDEVLQEEPEEEIIIDDNEEPEESEHVEPVIEPEPEAEANATKVGNGRGRFLWGFLLGMAATALLGFLLYFFVLQKMLTGPEHPNVEMIVKADTIAEVKAPAVATPDSTALAADSAVNAGEEKLFPDTKPSDDVVYGIVTTKCYLTTLAKKHYGNYNLWPYIYEENKAILGHPDRITPGTRVVIPPLSKYGVDPNNKADVAKAKKMGDEIYARYR